jgi:hypothetical protein
MRVRPHPGYFLAGVVLAMTVLSVLGSRLVLKDLAVNFVRFSAKLGPASDFFPTAREIKAIVDAGPQDEQVVTVVVGGSSVFMGTSQSEPSIWTELLQRNLGDHFRVINLARQSGAPNDFGNFAAEMLLKENRPVIYVADGPIYTFTIPIQAATYKKSAFDAWERGFGLDWPARDSLMRKALWSKLTELREVAWGAMLDRYLNFDDFWNYVTYEYGGTIWTQYLATESFSPFREFKDPEMPPQWYRDRGYPGGETDRRETDIVRSQIIPPDSPHWASVRSLVEDQVPPLLREHTISVVDLNSPYYVSRLTADEQASFLGQAEFMTQLLKSCGVHQSIVASKDFTADDYSDRVHLSVAGGAKLAERVAAEVVKMAHEFGY